MISAYGKDKTLSPRELARALGVSESSVKRWIDAGRVPATLTSGGHRRIELLPALRFLRNSGRGLADPTRIDLLGLAPPALIDVHDAEAGADQLFELLRAGKDRAIEAVLLAALATRAAEPAEVFDGPVRGAMARIGDLWDGGHRGIFVEHRATQILLRVLDRIDALFDPPTDGLVAVGGSIDGDPGALPTRMAATVLASEGIYPVNLGADTPAAAFLEAADQLGAQLVWISVSHAGDAPRQSEALRRLVDELAERGIACILGGRELDKLELRLEGKAEIGRSMQELAAMARGLRSLHSG